MARIRGVKEARTALFYDIFRSWADRLPENGNSFMLFTGHPAGRAQVDHAVTNFEGCGAFPSDQTCAVQKFGMQIRASSSELDEAVRAAVTSNFVVSSKEMFDLPGRVAWVPREPALSEYLKEDPELDEEPRGLIPLEHSIMILARQGFHVRLEFSRELADLTRKLADRVGPGAGWYEVGFLFAGQHVRDVL